MSTTPGPATLEVITFESRHELVAADSLNEAWGLLAAASGYCGHQLGRCVEEPARYLLLIWWRRIEDHVLTFRQSDAYGRWRQLIDAHVVSVSSVRHFTLAACPVARPVE